MHHYHILDDRGKTIDIRLKPAMGKAFNVCDLPFAWTDALGRWRGDKYNPDGICINHCSKNLDEAC